MGVSYGTKMPNNPMSQLAYGACYVYRVIPTPRCQGPLVQDLSVDGVLIMISSAFECGTYFYFWKLWSVSYNGGTSFHPTHVPDLTWERCCPQIIFQERSDPPQLRPTA